MTAALGEVRSWILERNPDLTELDAETDIIETRIISSLQFVELVLLVEDLCGEMLDSDQISIEAFRTLKDIEKNFLPG